MGWDRKTQRVIKRNPQEEIKSIKNCWDEFIIEKKVNNLVQESIDCYIKCFRKLMRFLEPKNIVNCNEITESVINQWILSMKENEDIKDITINHYISNTRVFLNWLIEKGCCDDFPIKLLKLQEETVITYTDDELNTLLEKPKDENNFVENRIFTIVNWILGTGNRTSTILNLKLKDIDFTYKNIILTHTKSKKIQTIPLSKSLEVVIRDYIRSWRYDCEPNDYLFCGISGEKLSRMGLKMSFSRYCKSRGIQKTSIHKLRHNFSKLWILNNGDVFRLQKMLGHTTLDMTRKYVNMFSSDLHKDFEKYNPLDNLKKGMSRKQVVQKSS